MRPLIGLSTYREHATWGVWSDLAADLLPAAYARAVEAAGGIPVLLPPTSVGAEEVVGRLDALVISGGADVDPRRYGEEPHPSTNAWRTDRDAAEWALLDAAAARDLPTVGVCRGMQVMAAWAGGSLEQHVPERTGSTAHSPGADLYGAVEVATVARSRVAALLGDTLSVRCHHHQSVREHPGLAPAAYAADGTLEAFEDPGRRFWLGVQWHPETGEDVRLFRGLVEAAGGSPVDQSAD